MRQRWTGTIGKVVGVLVALWMGSARATPPPDDSSSLARSGSTRARSGSSRTRSGVAGVPAGAHFDPASPAWNGCSQLVQLATQEGLQVEAPRTWDWRLARVQDPIVILAPQNESLDPAPLLRFVREGGRVLLADDFGAGDQLWEPFGLWGRRAPIPPTRDKPVLDVHYTVPHPYMEADFLLREGSFVFLNLPQWFFLKEGSPVQPLLFARVYRSNLPDRRMEGYVMVRARRGTGTMVVLSDPSALINQMIAYGDNRRLARSILRYLTLPFQARRVVLLWGDFSWKGTFTKTTPALAKTSLYVWDLLADFNNLLTSTPAHLKAFPPHWNKQSKLATARHKLAQARSDLMSKTHLHHIANAWWMLAVLLLGWIAIGLRWMPWFPERAYDLAREQEEHLIPHRLTEQVDAHRNNPNDFLWPLIVLKEEFAYFLHQHLPPVRADFRARHPAGSIPLDLLVEVKASTLAQSPVGTRAWYQLVQYAQEHTSFRMTEPQWKHLHRLLVQLPERRDWEHLMNEPITVNAKQLKLYHQTTLSCLRQLSLLDEFRAPLREAPSVSQK